MTGPGYHTGLDGVLRFIQANLDRRLSLDVLAHQAGLSTFAMHRRFKRCTGETPARYVERLRIERAAHALLFHEASVLDVSLESGYENPETFSRAFRRHLDASPREFRRRGLLRSAGALPDRRAVDSAVGRYELSASRLQELRTRHVACRRRSGPYETVPDALWSEIETQLRRRRIGRGPLIGIGHDAVGAVDPRELRFDAGIVVDRAFESRDGVFGWELPRGPYLLTSHVGPYATLPDAIPKMVERVRRLKGFRPAGLPVIEVYHTNRMNAGRTINQTDVYLPVERSARRRVIASAPASLTATARSLSRASAHRRG